jgi:hypothetical protein
MEEQAVGYYLQKGFYCEDDEEEILYPLLQRDTGEKKTMRKRYSTRSYRETQERRRR